MADLKSFRAGCGPAGEVADSGFDYSAFATHATDPDGALVREVEKLIEGYHRRPDLPDQYRQPLELCVDGRDFVFPRRSRDASGESDTVETIVRAYQRRCRALLVFAGPESRLHPWVNAEIKWWDEERPDGPVYLVITHGENPADLDALLPPALIERGGADNEIFFDLRGFYGRTTLIGHLWEAFAPRRSRRKRLRHAADAWRSIRPFREEVSKLAARLVSDATGGALAVADLETAYAEADRRVQRRTAVFRATASAAILGACGAAVYAGAAYLAEARERQAVAWVHQADVMNQQMGPGLSDALAFAASALLHSDDPRARETLLKTAQKLSPIERHLTPSIGGRLSEQTQVVRLFDDARLLAAGGRDGVLHVMSLGKETVKVSTPLAIGRIRSIQFHAGRRLLIVGGDRGLRAIDVGQPLRLDVRGVALEGERIGGVVLDPERGQILAGSFDGKIYALPLDPGRQTWSARLLTQIMDPRFFAKGWYDVPSSVFGIRLTEWGLVVAGIDGVLTVFDIDAHTLTQKWQHVHPESIFSMDATPIGRRIAVADQAGGLTLYDLDADTERRLLDEAQPAGAAPNAAGRWSIALPERTAAVGVAFDPSGTLLGLTGFDRTVRFYLSDTLAPVGAVVHGATTRSITFSADGAAFTAGDDGIIYKSSPLDMRDFPRKAGVVGFATLPGRGELVFWSQADDRHGDDAAHFEVYAYRPDDDEVTLLVTTDANLGLATAAAFGGGLALRPAATTKIELVAYESDAPPCADGKITHPNEPGNVQIVRRVEPGPGPDELTTFSVPSNGGTTVARIFGADDCLLRRVVSFASVPKRAAIAPGAIAAADPPSRARAYLQDGLEIGVDFEEEISQLAVAQDAEALAVLTHSGSVCLCRSDAGGGRSEDAVCHATSETHLCREIGTGALGASARPAKLTLDPAGEILVAASSTGAISVAAAASGWSFRPVAPAQLAPRDAPVAFSSDGSRLAVPAGQTGAIVLDTSTLQPIAYVPTLSRVTRIAFLEDRSNRLVTLDAGVLRVWRYERKELLSITCRRWPVGTTSNRPGLSTPLERSEICGRH